MQFRSSICKKYEKTEFRKIQIIMHTIFGDVLLEGDSLLDNITRYVTALDQAS